MKKMRFKNQNKVALITSEPNIEPNWTNIEPKTIKNTNENGKKIRQLFSSL